MNHNDKVGWIGSECVLLQLGHLKRLSGDFDSEIFLRGEATDLFLSCRRGEYDIAVFGCCTRVLDLMDFMRIAF